MRLRGQFITPGSREVCPARQLDTSISNREAHPINGYLRLSARQYRWMFPLGLDVPRDARRLLEPVLHRWGLSPDQRDDVLLVTTELVSNAVEHARTELVIVVRFTGAAVVQVSDESAAEPHLQPFNTNASRAMDSSASRRSLGVGAGSPLREVRLSGPRSRRSADYPRHLARLR